MPVPDPGSVIDGYRFNGGDPNDQASWTPVTPQAQRAYRSAGGGGGRTSAQPGGGQVQADANIRGRVNLSLDPVVDAQRRMAEHEARGNPYGSPAAAVGEYMIETDRAPNGEARNGLQTRLGRFVGGPNLQLYNQAASTFESSLMPVFSGSAVTQSEASRFIRANLPEVGDSPQVLAQKAHNRQQIVNAAARMIGQPEPFPGVGSWMAGRDPGRQAATPEQQAALDTLNGNALAFQGLAAASQAAHAGRPRGQQRPQRPQGRGGYRVLSVE